MTNTPPAMPAWPEPPSAVVDNLGSVAWHRHERARADAWEARARLAVEELECLYPALELDLRYADSEDDRDALLSRVQGVRQALRLIGPLPPLPPTETKEPNEQGTGA
jgi:hypothetical protein